MQDLKVTIVQSPLTWENVDANLKGFTDRLNTIKPGDTDLIVLPEMFSTGFTMNAAAVAEEMSGKAVQWLKTMAADKQCVITGSIIIKENDGFFNRLVWMRPDGSYETYNKRHLFRMANEHHTYRIGEDKIIVELKGWKICPLICYDLRFPVYSRNRNNEYDCLIYVANWPEVRSYPWKQLLIGRAIENLSYVIGVNRIGKDGTGLDHSGDSGVLNFRGQPISTTQPHQDAVETVVLSRSALEEFRKIFPAHLDADNFTLKES